MSRSSSAQFYNATRVGNTVVISIHITPVQFTSLNKVAMALNLGGASRSEIIRRVLDDGFAMNLGEEFTDARREEGKYVGNSIIADARIAAGLPVTVKSRASFDAEFVQLMKDIEREDKAKLQQVALDKEKQSATSSEEVPSAELLALRAERERKMPLNAESLRAGIHDYTNQTPKE